MMFPIEDPCDVTPLVYLSRYNAERSIEIIVQFLEHVYLMEWMRYYKVFCFQLPEPLKLWPNTARLTTILFRWHSSWVSTSPLSCRGGGSSSTSFRGQTEWLCLSLQTSTAATKGLV